jgi:four helix bundle protein
MEKSFEDLLVWQKAHQLVLRIYEITKEFPKEEVFGLTTQLRRAVSSITMNIVEGTGLSSQAEFRRTLYIARGSLKEVQYQVLLSKDLGYISKDTYDELKTDIHEIGKLLNGLINSVNSRLRPGSCR